MKKFLQWIILGLCLVALCPWQALADMQLPPAPATDIYIQDYAGMVDDQTKQAILALGAKLEDKTGAQIVAVTVNDLQGYPIEEYANSLFRSWGIGQKDKNNGVLLLVAKQERKIRIEVGYGLEGVLPDGKTGRIQDEQIIPYFKQGQFSQGIYNGYSTLVQEVAGEYKVSLDGEQQAAPVQVHQIHLPGWVILLIILGLIFFLFLDFHFFGGALTWLILGSLRGGRGGGGFGGGGFGGGSSGGGGSSRGW